MSAARPALLCLVVDRAISRTPLTAAVAAAVREGVDWLQLRDRSLTGAELLRLARELDEAARDAAQARGRALKVLVNRRVDVAIAMGADGVHLGFDALSPHAAAALLDSLARSGAEIGVSAHSPEQVEAAAGSAATYAHLAPIWTPLSKRETRPALGVEALAAASRSELPVFAQGGITPARCEAALAAGAAGVAVTGDILLAPDPGRAAAELRAALDG